MSPSVLLDALHLIPSEHNSFSASTSLPPWKRHLLAPRSLASDSSRKWHLNSIEDFSFERVPWKSATMLEIILIDVQISILLVNEDT